MEDVALAGVHVRCRIDGADEGPAVLLVNSLGCDHSMWERQVGALSAEHRVVRYGARGQGGTHAPPSPYSLADLGDDAIAVLDHHRIERAHVVGVSLGGIVALWLAVNRPDRLLTATYANTAARIGTADGWEERIAAVRDGGMGAISELVMERFFSDRFRREEPAAVAAVKETFEAHDPEGYIGYCTALRDGDLRSDLTGIAVPSLVVGGDADVSTPPELARSLQKQVPGARFVVLDAGHLSNLERPDGFNRAVLSHLTGQPRDPR